MHLHCEMDPPNLHSAAQNNQAKSLCAVQLNVGPTGVSDGAHRSDVCCCMSRRLRVCAVRAQVRHSCVKRSL